ncbi:hypothetical protein A0130_06155 [Leifsonia xyli]|uniref:hypothetical protein n=1 Tax=Leifsonia xyli TaxID=1575 RepID=UPI0007CDB3AA|nr:hypothetical protein A0130_06155 [Leifsonia xyli]
MIVALSTMALVGVVTSGCSSFASPRFGGGGDIDEPNYDEQVQDDGYEPDFEPPTDWSQWQPDSPVREPDGLWSCSYSPTFDRDWHNDVLCENRLQTERPYLREWDSYVTQDEIMESAREYEAQLNAGR